MTYPLCCNAALSWGQRLSHAVTAWDRKQATRAHYNVNALGIYLGRAEDVAAAIATGTPPADAIREGFCAPLQSFILKVTEA